MIPVLVPRDARGPGTIGLRQTTFVEVVADRGGMYRIHFEDKQEFALAPGTYPRVVLEATHPLLLDYIQPWASLYISASSSKTEAVARSMEAAVSGLCEGWRSLDNYANGPAREILRGGQGLLLRGPMSVCEVVVDILERHAVRHSMLHAHAARTQGRVVLVLGHSYVIAGGFSFERRPS